MPTVELNVTEEWVNISSGTNEATCQVQSGSLRLVDSPTKPSANMTGHTIEDYTWVNITPPTIAWIRTNGVSAAHVALTVTP